ncbi:hypothetical protein B0H13DRAFT_2323814 [Mycena leptocephala]|nr:hypothetical protein B0H13DRAFT_2323814 [Mycena leptocephala]
MPPRAETSEKIVKKKPGNKGDFLGMRLTFLLSRLDDYLAASKVGQTRLWWPKLMKDYWEKFHWRLELTQEPVEGDVWPPDDVLSVTGIAQKTKRMEDIKQKIKTWYNHKRTALGLTKNPWTPWLARLRRPDDKSPKRITDHQFYMQHDDFKGAVTTTFNERHWDVPRSERLARRCDVARELFEAEPDEVKKRIREEAMLEHEGEVRRWHDAVEGLPSMEVEDQEEARAKFTGVVAPLLQALRAYTGYHVTLIAGRVVDGKFDLKSAHAGKTKSKEGEDGGKDFTEWDTQAYKNRVLDQFMRFLVAAEREPGSEDTPSVLPPATAPPPSLPAREQSILPPQRGTRESRPFPDNGAPGAANTSLPLLDDQDDPPAALAGALVAAYPRTREQSLEDRMKALPILEVDLRAKLMSLGICEREARVEALERMGELELRRTNNTARREAELARIKAQGGHTGLEEDVGKVMNKRKKKAVKSKPRKRQTRARRGDHEDSAEETEEGSAQESDGDDVEIVRAEPPQTRGRGRKQTTGTATEDAAASSTPGTAAAGPGTGIATDDAAATVSSSAKRALTADGAAAKQGNAEPEPTYKAPKWAKEAHATLFSGDLANDDAWRGTAGLWWTLEASTAFVSPVKGFGAEGRPEEIQTWIRYARKGTPKIKDMNKFAKEWQAWWTRLNPEWRIDDGALLKEARGSWETLRKPGANGFLGVLAGLKWWREALGATSEWTSAFEDVTWVLQALTAKSATDREPAAATTDSETGAGAGVEAAAAIAVPGVAGANAASDADDPMEGIQSS